MPATLGGLTAQDLGQPITLEQRTAEGSRIGGRHAWIVQGTLSAVEHLHTGSTRVVLQAADTHLELVLPADTLIE